MEHGRMMRRTDRAEQRLRLVRPVKAGACAASLAACVLLGAASTGLLAGCSGEGGMKAIDRKVEALLLEGNESINETTSPRSAFVGDDVEPGETPAEAADDDPASPDMDAELAASTAIPLDPADERPATVNPDVEALDLERASELRTETEQVIARLEGYNELPDEPIAMNLEQAIRYAVRNSREHRFAEEEYLLTSLSLLIERHLWGPRFFNDITASINADGDEGLYDTSLDLVNEFRVTQRLPYGGEVSARALATFSQDLHNRVAGENASGADIILQADIPLLRGAGLVAREDIIQAERNLIYAARDFARFRREFVFDVTQDFLNLIVLRQQIENARLQVESFRSLEARQEALNEAGRSTRFDLAEAQNETLEAVDRLNNAAENYRLALDRFKVRIGMPVPVPLAIEPSTVDLPTPAVEIEESVYLALQYRLDLQTQRDLVGDARRAVANARNDLLADLDLALSASMSTDDDRERAGLDFEPEGSDFFASITYGLPLDREIERARLRQTQIGFERSERGYNESRDQVVLSVRSAVRGIDAALFSLEIQERNVEIALLRQESIEADPARATTQQQTDAINQTLRARDARDNARRNLQVAILDYLLETGQLRVDAAGNVILPPGMRLEGPGEPAPAPPDEAMGMNGEGEAVAESEETAGAAVGG